MSHGNLFENYIKHPELLFENFCIFFKIFKIKYQNQAGLYQGPGTLSESNQGFDYYQNSISIFKDVNHKKIKNVNLK